MMKVGEVKMKRKVNVIEDIDGKKFTENYKVKHNVDAMYGWYWVWEYYSIVEKLLNYCIPLQLSHLLHGRLPV